VAVQHLYYAHTPTTLKSEQHMAMAEGLSMMSWRWSEMDVTHRGTDDHVAIIMLQTINGTHVGWQTLAN